MDLIQFVQSLGLPVALVLFFVWQSKLREDRLSDRLGRVEDYYRNEFSALVRENLKVMSRLEKWLETSTSAGSEREIIP